MPLMKKKILEKTPKLESLHDDDELYHCSMTGEVFKDYESYAERSLLYSSMIWTCSMTGKSNLTYAEALQSEDGARKILNKYPNELKIPVLYVATMTRRRGIGDMADDVFAYIKDRYFVGENVEVNIKANKWKPGHVLEVIAPNDKEITQNGFTIDKNSKQFYPPASTFKYEAELLEENRINGDINVDKGDNVRNGDVSDDDKEEEEEGSDDDNETNGEEVKQDDGNSNSASKTDLFPAAQIRRKKGLLTKEKMKLFLKQHVEINADGNLTIKEVTVNDFGLNNIKFNQIFDGPLPNFEVSVKKVKQETLFKYLTKGNANNAQQTSQVKKVKEEKPKQKEEEKEPPIDVNKEIKEWYKPKEDLELEDQKKMPQVMPVEIRIPLQYFGDMLMIIEFVNSFDDVLLIKKFFPHGFTLKIVEMALLERELAGSFTNLIQMLLNALFKLQEEEATQASTETENKSDFGHDNYQENDNLSLEDGIKFATAAVNYCKNYQGLSVSELPLYSLTVTEILRLHILTSGAQINFLGQRWRYQQRGGYTSQDDPGLDLCLKEPDIVQMLSAENVVNLSLDQKVKLITCLINQILTYADVRDIIEERLINSKQAKLQLKLAISTERRRRQELSSAKTKLKKDTENTIKFVADEMERLDRENENKLIEYEKEIEKFVKGSSDFQTFLGFDRAYRKYIKCVNVPGIFVECNSEFVGNCQTQLTKQIPYQINGNRAKLIKHLINFKQNAISNKENQPENEMFNEQHTEKANYDELYMCSTEPDNCIVHSTRNNNKWFFIHKEEQLEMLMDSLNMRGLRENELKQTLQENKEVLMRIISKTPGQLLNDNLEDNPNYEYVTEPVDIESTNFGYSSDNEPSLIERNVLLDLILKLESKIRNGNVSTSNVSNINVWRDMLTKEDYENFDKMFKRKIMNGSSSATTVNGGGSRSSTPDLKQRDPGEYLNQFINKDKIKVNESQLKAIKCLALALVQISDGVDLKNLKQPLGSRKRPKSRKDNNNKKIATNLLDKWQYSLLQSTSFSQVFLHYAQFENCIVWSKCRVCRNQNDTHKMLICDKCNLTNHLYCHKPPLKEIPTGDWYCRTCSADNEKVEQTTPPRKRRRIFRDESDEDESDNQEEDDNDSESDEMELDICVICNSAGELLSCSKCSSAYHIECVVPPLRRPPRGKWYCNKCKDKYDKDLKDNDGIAADDTTKYLIINKRRCAAARARNKIRGFTKTLRRSTDSDESGNEIASLSRRSLRRIAETRDDLPLHNATLQELLSDIMKHKDSWPFIRPVQKNEVPDYYDIINKPMDFGTIKYKLNMGEYKCDSDFMEDAFLVFDNCNTYNNSEAEVYKCGVHLCKYFEKKCKELGLKIPRYLLEYDDNADESTTHSNNRHQHHLK